MPDTLSCTYFGGTDKTSSKKGFHVQGHCALDLSLNDLKVIGV